MHVENIVHDFLEILKRNISSVMFVAGTKFQLPCIE